MMLMEVEIKHCECMIPFKNKKKKFDIKKSTVMLLENLILAKNVGDFELLWATFILFLRIKFLNKFIQ